MPIDTSIYSSLLRPPKSVADYDAEAQGRQQNALALQQGRQQLMMGQMKADEYTRGIQEQQQIRNALAGLGGQATDEQRIQTLKGTGLPGGFAQADALEKTLQERKKTGADVSYKEAQTAKERASITDAAIKRYRGALDFIDTPEGAARWMAAQYQDPTLAEHMSSMGPLDQVLQRIPSDPQGFQQWRQQAGMGMENYSKKLQEDAKIAETGRHNKAGEGIQIRGQDRQSADNAASRGVQLKIAGMVDSRARDSQAYQREKDAADRKGTGNATEGERNAAGYSARMNEADKLLDSLEAKGRPGYLQTTAGGIPLVGGAARTAVSNADQQMYRQAQEDWVRAKLRKESGASIASDEMDREIQAYFPQPGETSPDVLAQKKRARAIANEAMKKSAGRGAYESEVPLIKPGTVLKFDASGNPVN